MAINFPNNPNPNDTWSEVGKTWLWDGTTWKLNSTTASGISLTDLSVTKPNPTASGSGDVTYNNTTGVFTYTPPVVGSTSFTGLSDTPGSLTAGKWLKVNVGGTALEWTDAPSGSDTNDYLNTASLNGNTLTLTRTGSQSLSNVTVDLSSLNSVPTTITVADESVDTTCYPLFTTESTGDLEPKTGSNIKFNSASGQLEAGSFKKTGGTAAEFLKADGSIDTTTYLSSVALNDLSNVDATTNLANGKILKYDLGSTTWVVADDNTSGGGSANFTGLSDTPSAHSNNKWLKSNGSALIWTDAPVDTNTIYDLSGVATSNGFKTRLTGSDSTTDEVEFTPGGGISYTVSGNTCQISSINSLSGLSDVDYQGASPANNKILKFDTSVSKWVLADDVSGSGGDGNDYVTGAALGTGGNAKVLTLSFGNTSLNQTVDLASIDTNTTYGVFQGTASGLVPASDSNTSNKYLRSDGTWQVVSSGGGADGNDYVTGAALGTGGNAKVLTLSFGDTSLNQTVDLASIDSNTIYDLTGVATGNGAKVRLTGSDSTTDEVEFTAGGGISYTVTGNTIQISSLNSLSGLSDTTITASPTDNYVLTYDSASSKWEPQPVPSGSTSFTGLSDTPGSLTAGKWLKVNAGGTALEYTNEPTDTNTNYYVSCVDGINSDEERIRLLGSDGTQDYVTLEAGTGLSVARDGDKITFTNTVSNTDTNTTYDLTGVATGNGAKVRLTGSDSTEDDVELTPGGGISYTVTGNTIQISSINSLSGLSDTDISGSPSNGDVLKWNGTDWAPGTDNSGGGSDGNDYVTNLSLSGTTLTAEFGNSSLNQSINLASIDTNTNTTYSVSCVDGDNVDEEKIRLTAGGSGSGTDDIVLEAGTGLTIARSGDKITFANSETDTKYDLTGVATGSGFKIRLAGLTASGNTNDDIELTPGGGISYTVTGNTCQISSINSLSGLSDTDIGSSPSTGDVLKWNGTDWAPGTDNSGGGADGNNYVTSASWSSSTGQLTLTRGGSSSLSSVTANVSNLVTYLNANLSSGDPTIRTDNDSSWHYPVFVDSSTDNISQTLKIDSGMKYYPGANWLQLTSVQCQKMYDWTSSYGSSGQFLMSKGSSSWEWSSHVEQNSSGELLLKRTDTSQEGGHLQFEDADGNNSFAIDVYGTSTSNSVWRIIDQQTQTGGTGTERFSVNRSGAFGIGHIAARDFGSEGKVLTSHGSSTPPSWESASGGSSGFRVATNVRSSDDNSFSNNSWKQIMVCAISKDSGSDILVQSKMNFAYGIYNDTDEDGWVNVYFLLVRRQGNSGSWSQIGQELALTNLYNESANYSGTKMINMFAGLDAPDAALTNSSFSGSSPLYYAVWAKYLEQGNDAPTNPLKILRGSSIVAMEY